MKKHLLLLVSGVLFCVLFFVGIQISQGKPLWTDEIYTQIRSVQQISYGGILAGRVDEGNNFPLFYLLQKTICRFANFQIPENIVEDSSVERSARVFLRIQPNVFMSLSLVMVFYFFSRLYSPWAGGMAFLVALSAPAASVWTYWAEARPYALWFFLTTAQLLLFLAILREKKRDLNTWRCLMAVEVLLSLTTLLGFIQVIIVSFFLWALKEREWKKYFWLIAGTLGAWLFYYLQRPKYQFSFPETAMQLIFPCIPREWMLIAVVYAAFALLYYLQKKNGRLKFFDGKARLEDRGFLGLLVLMLAVAFAVLALFKWQAVPTGKGFEVSHRYFFYLTAVGIVSVNVFLMDLLELLKGRPWLRFNVGMVIAGLLIISFLRNTIWGMWVF